MVIEALLYGVLKMGQIWCVSEGSPRDVKNPSGISNTKLKLSDKNGGFEGSEVQNRVLEQDLLFCEGFFIKGEKSR